MCSGRSMPGYLAATPTSSARSRRPAGGRPMSAMRRAAKPFGDRKILFNGGLVHSLVDSRRTVPCKPSQHFLLMRHERDPRSSAGKRTVNARRALSGRNHQSRRRPAREGALPVRRPGLTRPCRGISGRGARPVMRHGDRERRVGPALRSASAGTIASVPRDPRSRAPRRRHTRRSPFSHSRPPF